MLRFAVHRLGSPIASPRSHGVPRRDVPCRVHISVEREAACRAPENGLALARFPVRTPAYAAALTRKCRSDLLDPPGSLVIQATDQQSPSGREDLPVQSSFLTHSPAGVVSGSLSALGHVLDAQLLDTDHIEPASQVSADPLAPVPASIGLSNLETGDCDLGLDASVTAAFRAGQPTFRQAQMSLTRLAQLGAAQQFAVRQGCAHGHAAVNADDLTGAWALDGLGDRGEGHVPPASMVQSDPERLHATGDGTGPAEPDPPTLGDEHFPSFPVQSAHVLGPDRDDTEPFVASGFAPARPPVSTGEAVPHGLVEVSERLLLHHLTADRQPSMFPPRGGELPALQQVTRCACPSWTPPRLLLASKVPHEPGVGAMLPQCCFSGSRREQAVPGHAKTLSSNADIPEEVKRRVLHCSKEVTTPRTV